MSCLENEKLWETIYETVEENGLDAAVFAEMDFEEAYDYLITGEVPDSYDRILYLMYKA